ncbi:MAG: hypothetical protein ACREV5_13265 [Steroidobacter sp.]
MLVRSPSSRSIEPRARASAQCAGLAAALACLSSHADVAGVPKELLFVGLTHGEWRLIVGEGSAAPRRIDSVSEPRTPAYSLKRNRIAYVSSAGELREIDLISGADSVLLKPSREIAFTQPAYRPESDEIYVVALRGASSVDTDIVRVDRSAQRTVPLLRQRSAQFEPSFTRDGARMLYSNVVCGSECPKIVQELWSMDVVGGVAEQITLLNSVSRQAAAGGGDRIVFASSKSGHYQLWGIDAAGASPRRLTESPAVDESPVIGDAGEIYFVRRTAAGGGLMRVDVSGRAQSVALPDSISDVRDVRWGG